MVFKFFEWHIQVFKKVLGSHVDKLILKENNLLTSHKKFDKNIFFVQNLENKHWAKIRDIEPSMRFVVSLIEGECQIISQGFVDEF